MMAVGLAVGHLIGLPSFEGRARGRNSRRFSGFMAWSGSWLAGPSPSISILVRRFRPISRGILRGAANPSIDNAVITTDPQLPARRESEQRLDSCRVGTLSQDTATWENTIATAVSSDNNAANSTAQQ